MVKAGDLNVCIKRESTYSLKIRCIVINISRSWHTPYEIQSVVTDDSFELVIIVVVVVVATVVAVLVTLVVMVAVVVELVVLAVVKAVVGTGAIIIGILGVDVNAFVGVIIVKCAIPSPSEGFSRWAA